MKDVYELHKSTILQEDEIADEQSVYNFIIDKNYTLDHIMEQAQYIYQEQRGSFKLNFSIGLILQNSETNDMRYFNPSQC